MRFEWYDEWHSRIQLWHIKNVVFVHNMIHHRIAEWSENPHKHSLQKHSKPSTKLCDHISLMKTLKLTFYVALNLVRPLFVVVDERWQLEYVSKTFFSSHCISSLSSWKRERWNKVLTLTNFYTFPFASLIGRTAAVVVKKLRVKSKSSIQTNYTEMSSRVPRSLSSSS